MPAELQERPALYNLATLYSLAPPPQP
jgi:hypothetical protein